MSTSSKIALIGPSGSGKSTAAEMLGEAAERMGLSFRMLKLAEPLYKVQALVYAEAGTPVKFYSQDQSLLETVAGKMRQISATALVDNLMGRLSETAADVVINDDLRDDAVDWPAMVRAGFKVVRVYTESRARIRRLTGRKDLKTVVKTDLDDQVARIRADYVLTNNAGPAELRFQVDSLAEYLWLREK